MKHLTSIAALAAGATTLLSGDVTGTVTLKGTPPAEKPIAPLMADVNCGKAAKGTVTTRHYVVGAGAGLGNVFVYVKAGLDGKKFDAPATVAAEGRGTVASAGGWVISGAPAATGGPSAGTRS